MVEKTPFAIVTYRGESSWIHSLSLIAAAVSALSWYIGWLEPWWLLLIGVLPAARRLVGKQWPFRRTVFDLPLALFALSAGSGVWAAYDRNTAWEKFGIILSGLLLFYALAEQPRPQLPSLAVFLALSAVGVGTYFLLTHDWRQHPADLVPLNQLGLWWMARRPQFETPALLPNVAGGLLAMLAPIGLAALLQSWKRRQLGSLTATGLAVLLMAAALALTSSRAAWIALGAGLALWALGVTTLSLTVARPRLRRVLAMAGVITAGLILMLLLTAGAERLIALANRLPGLDSGASRWELYQNTYRLAHDFAFTGGGLAAFAGLYSRYMLGIPVFLFGYSHNLFLDVALEQGLFGLLSLVGILLGSGWLLIRCLMQANEQTVRHPLPWSLLASLAIVILHGLIDDPLYAYQGTPLLFLIPGLIVAFINSEPVAGRTNISTSSTAYRTLPRSATAAAFFVIMAVPALWLWPAIAAHWYANRGAVAMARHELTGWQNTAINEFGLVDASTVRPWLNRAAALASQQVTAHYRLGLLALQRENFDQAALHLGKAYTADPGHRGVQKVLAFTYVWLGKPEKAMPMLAAIPEAQAEMEYYAWLWASQGKTVLAERAAEAAAWLRNPPSGGLPMDTIRPDD